MQTTMTISANLNCSVFDIFNQSAEEVIMIINYYLRLGEGQPQTVTVAKNATTKKEKRIKVNNKTATGGWF